MEYLFLIALNFLLFYRTIGMGYVVDDNDRLYTLQEKRKTNGFKDKPIAYVLDHLTYGAGAFKNLKHDHAATLALNAINAALVFKITGNIYAATLWLINPINNQIAVWMNGRRYALSIALLLMGLVWTPAFVLFYPAAAWTHVLAAPAALLLIPTKYVFLLPAAAMAFKMFAWKKIKARYKARGKFFAEGNELLKIRPKKAVIFVKSIGYYFTHILFPTPRMYHEFLYYFGRYEKTDKEGYALNFEFYKGLAVCVFLFYEIAIAHNLWAAWFLIFIAQWCGISTVTQNVADRYCSAPAIGLMMVLCKYLFLLPPELQAAAFAGFAVFYLTKYQPMIAAYENMDSFFDYHIAIQPDGVSARTLYATKLLERRPPRQDVLKAFVLVKDGYEKKPHDFQIQILLIQTLFATNQIPEVLQMCDIAEKHVPKGEEEIAKIELDKIRDDCGRILKARSMRAQMNTRPRANPKARKKCKR
jgi:hypothetical protein